MSFFEELKRRNVVRMAVLYGVASWLILQVCDVLFDQLDVPSWAFRLVLILLGIGFPFALIFSWIYELTPEGLKREHQVDRNQSITRDTGRKLNVVTIALVVLALIGLVFDRLMPERETSTPAEVAEPTAAAVPSTAEPPTGQTSSEDPLSIAVLPFVNMSGDADNEYFSDGLSEELLNTLVQIRELKVTGRTSSFAFKGQNLDLREVGERLNVAHVLEGSVRKAANRVRITAQLIKTDDGYHLWSETFDRELNDIFAIQAEIAEQVAQALSLTLLGASDQPAAATKDTGAYEAFLRGSHIFRRAPDDREALEAARKYFEQSIALDADYVSPRYGMFDYWDRVNRNGFVPFKDSHREMEAQAAQLKHLAPKSMEGLLAQARSKQVGHEWRESLVLYKEARDRYPGSVEASFFYGSALFFTGQTEEGVRVLEAGVELDPLSLQALGSLGAVYTQLGQCDKVQQIATRALEIEADYGRVHGQLGYCTLNTGGDPEEAIRWLDQEPLTFIRTSGRAIALNRLGRQAEAEQELVLLREDSGDSAAFQFAQVYAQWGEKEKALEWLRKAVDLRDPGLLIAKVDRFLDPIRDDPGFQAIMKEIGLADCCNL